ncbi:hypothetical protein R70723_21560 [Paenibacillus sp. FSL R7-0273]|uniref:hypothetical protein n=1 Tax=Paenibacillus sp. FSL R7-0273 TaxID=1536772 RepID=UPI0004F90B48|nr:hypothetical protein [Paenibacillus sp. FSL R7-0273]AIQ48209.1 hypothetical protein R70723_21560 [Paenibacillus sp. FSL R7-0273]OMF91975.1 hypothetical protein BK144_14615 [Paenibacillus sp. FSL R7-0273]
MGKYALKTDPENRILHIQLEGTFSNEDGLKSIQAYQQIVNPITSSEYSLQIDCRKLNVTAPDVVPLLESCFHMFKSDGFQQVSLALENNPLLKMQLSRLGRKAGLENMLIVPSF